MFCWGGSSEKPYGQKDLSREDLSRGGEVAMRIVTYRIGDMRAVMIEEPAVKLSNLSGSAPALYVN